MSLTKKSLFKNLLALVVLMLVMVAVAGCRKDDKIELSFAKNSYEVTVGEEIEVTPTVKKGKDVGEVKLVYSSENPNIATYANGKVTGVAVGETKIKVAVEGRPEVYKEVKVTVVAREYTITYKLNGGTLTNALEKFTEDQLPLTLPTPTREGYVFAGWYLTSDFSGNAVTQITEAKNITVYAKWAEPVVEYTITYELNGGTLQNPKTKFTASELPLTLATPTKEGYTFAGWYLTSDFSGNAVTQITEAKNVTVYAKWEAIEYTITYELNEGTLENPKTKFTASELPLTLATPTKEGYTFAGWYLTSDFSGNAVTQITEAKNVTVYAKWEAIEYTITYELNEGTLPAGAVSKFTIEDLAVTLPTPTREGYDFEGWYLTSNFSGEPITKITTIGNVTVYAKWTVTLPTYEIIYHLDGGVNPADAPTHYREGEAVTLPIPTKENYVFMGWYTDPDFENGPVTEIPAGSSGPKVFYAYFEERIVSTITYNLDGGRFINTIEQLKYEFMLDYYEFIKPAMSFDDFAHGEGKTSGYQGPWATPNAGTYAIERFYVAGGSKDPDPNSQYFINRPEYNAKWLPFFELLDQMVTETNATQNFWGSTWTGHIRFREFMVGSRYNDASSIARFLALNIIPRSLVTEFDNFTDTFELLVPGKEGYVFGGWYTSSDFSGEPITKVEKGTTRNLVLYAKWEQIYTITYELDGGTLENPIDKFTSGDLPITLPTPTKEGHNFVGWYLTGDFSGDPVVELTEAKNYTLYAKWEEAVTYLTVLEARNAQNNEVVEVRGIVTGKIGNSFFLQDSTAGVYVYMGNDSKFNDKLIIGNDVVVTGKRALYNQLVQISNVTSVEVLNTNVQLPAIKTYETLDPQELLNVQGQRVSIPNLTIASIPVIGTGSYSVVVSSGSTTVEIRIDRYVEDFAEIKEFFQGMVVGQGIDVEGVFAGRFNQTVQLMVTDVNQLKAKPITKELFTSLLENKLNPGQNIVDNLNLQTSIVIAGTTYQVTWQSSNPEVINPDGTVVRPEIGEDDVNVVLTVKTTFNDEEITITFEVTVLAKRDSSQVITYVETFDTFTSTSSSYVNGIFVGVNGIEWEYNALRGGLIQDNNDYSIDGKGVMFANQTEHSGGVSFLKATISGGIGDFKVDTLKAFTSGAERKLGLYINGELKGEFTLDNSVTTVQVFEVKGINVSGTFTLELRMLTPGTERAQITIDNLTWTTFE